MIAMRIARLVVAGVLLLVVDANAAPFGAGPTKNTVKDEHSAILIARAMIMASTAPFLGTPQQERQWRVEDWSEDAWLARCTARLDHGIWIVTNRGPHKPRTGFFSGAVAIYIGADDGRFLGELFI